MNLEGRSLKQNFIRFIIPSVLSQWIFTLYTMVDGMFVAIGVSEVALTAVNLSFPFIAFLFALSLMFAVGTSTVTAILLGEKKTDRASEVFTQNIVLVTAISAVIAAAVMLNLERFARFLGAPDEQTLGYVMEYLSWIAPFSFSFLLSYSFEIILKTDGFPQKAALAVAFGAIENCILDWLFVIVFDFGLAGAAFATSLSQITLLGIYFHHFFGRKGLLYFRKFKFDLSLVWREVKNGFSSGVTELSSGLVTFMFNQVILIYLTRDALVSYTIVSYINSIVVLSATGIAQGSQPLISYYYGQGRMDNCRKLLKYCVVTAGAFCAVSFVLGYLLAGSIVSIYVGPELEALRAYSTEVFRIFIISFLLVGFNVAFSGYFTSVEQPAPALLIAAGRGFVLLAGSLFVMTKLFGAVGIWWSPTLSEAVCLAMTLILFAVYCRRDPRWRQTKTDSASS